MSKTVKCINLNAAPFKSIEKVFTIIEPNGRLHAQILILTLSIPEICLFLLDDVTLLA